MAILQEIVKIRLSCSAKYCYSCLNNKKTNLSSESLFPIKWFFIRCSASAIYVDVDAMRNTLRRKIWKLAHPN